MEAQNKTPQKRLFVGSLPYKFTEGELLSLFIPFGKVVAVRIMHTRWGKSRGLGYVEFEDLDSAVKAKDALHHHSVGERTIIVDFAQPDPFDTPEGQLRHQEAEQKRQERFKFRKNKFHSQPSGNSDDFPIKRRGSDSGKRLRQSVYDQRAHGAKVGAKFSTKTRNKKK